jgi:hypothetical protein
MVFEGTNASSSVFGNYMYDSQDGLVLLNNGKIGPQGSPPIPILLPNGRSSDNQWIGPFFHAATYTMNTFAPNTHSPIYYRNNIPAEHPTGSLNATTGLANVDDYNVVGTINGFNQVPQSAQGTNCNLPPALAQQGNGAPNQRVAMEQIATDSVTGDPSEQWIRKQQVYFMIRKDSTLLNNSPILQQFYATTQPSAIGIVDSVDIELAENNPSNAVSVNATIIPQTQIELNHQIVNDIYSALMTGDSSTVSQRAALTVVAEQCPLTGGNAVYRARTMLSLIEDEVLFYEDSCTVVSGSRIGGAQTFAESSVSQTNFNLYPNPNNGMMTLNYVLEEEQTASFALFDMTGRAVTQFNLPTGQQTFNLDQAMLAPGMYYYAYYVDGSLLKSDKVIISK